MFTSFNDWVAKWGIPEGALVELHQMVNASGHRSEESKATTEEGAQNEVMLEYSYNNANLMRCNTGAGKLVDGGFVRWGLCNESEKINEVMKCSDLIGIQPVLIKPRHVGQTFGLFIAREIKRPGWSYRGTKREQGQLNFINMINGYGGNAAFATGRGSYVYF